MNVFKRAFQSIKDYFEDALDLGFGDTSTGYPSSHSDSVDTHIRIPKEAYEALEGSPEGHIYVYGHGGSTSNLRPLHFLHIKDSVK